MRIDSFIDQRNSYDWHQERSYYPMNEDGNGIVVWIALSKISTASDLFTLLKAVIKKGSLIPLQLKIIQLSIKYLNK